MLILWTSNVDERKHCEGKGIIVRVWASEVTAEYGNHAIIVSLRITWQSFKLSSNREESRKHIDTLSTK